MVMKSILLALSSFTAANAVDYSGTFGGGGPPRSFSEKEFAAFFENANASASYDFDGWNISRPFPPDMDDEPDVKWKATIAVATVDDEEDGAYPGTRITIEVPEEMRTDPETGNRTSKDDEDIWRICFAVWSPSILKESAWDGAQDTEGGCSSFLSDECISDLEVAGTGTFYEDDGTCIGPPSIPSSCEKLTGDSGGSFGFGVSDPASAGMFNGSTTMNYAPVPNTGKNGDFDETYDNAVRGVWIILMSWGRRDPRTWSTSDPLTASVLCMRASEVAEGSDDPNTGAILTGTGVARLASLVAGVASIIMLC